MRKNRVEVRNSEEKEGYPSGSALCKIVYYLKTERGMWLKGRNEFSECSAVTVV